MSVGRKIFLVALAVCACVFGIFWLLLINQDYFQETNPKFYNNLEAAKVAGAIEAGWLPDFLPKSAMNIHEKHNSDYNTVIVSFAFEKADFTELIKHAQEVPESRFREIAPTWVYKNEPWFPKQIVKGEIAAFVRDGFRVYEFKVQSEKRTSEKKWFMITHPEMGIAFIWKQSVI